ncbi:D-glycerate dehydrogenase [Candidatus Berkelbacteria bacterium CG_4_8_14_3_um_filter_33_6]|uniref:D-glycerate dehydrogenase n=2 Tax=Bacteria candidate phyla TaxID=1783234 RepID=A0A2M7XN34_9BACT|nr:MAG: D-glycerate dehydrogenase [Candidatus Berkelbacteria bacterium CG23_combo_of_CG06-09_8_20_14_all_33_15]PIS08323.1 MAG: D-glycerate dehydrogenase [Candidatus Berkelbacteria bacterium CG10_big_fil_rev_8_21_14_0_10_33_10]PIX30948.1 MAG: D-glycerate dehydrogenase [Candidatus Berkelbacteria bacterium CG_4_8_14_3_um_filter_33_6]PIZ28098.1 MAG: D-glycerate dehydrogenase [Candidatus Berkelbacteria bacterium CG_4_10_14_0_8_um_filter_35_9_33_8]PJA20500.1 MAG: D-glycerate dehydrogenase [Candidatus
MKIFVTYPINEIGIKYLRDRGVEVVVNHKKRPLRPRELEKILPKYNGAITMLFDRIDQYLIDKLGPNFKIIANYAVGFDNIDIESAKQKNIIVTNTPGILTEAVAEHTWALILASARRVLESNRDIKNGLYKFWQPSGWLGPQVWGKTLGIVGLGRIGSFVAEIGYYGFKTKIIYYDLKRDDRFELELKAKHMPLKELFERSDIISIHVPLNEKTYHLIGKDVFNLMKKNAILVNTARGGIIDNKSLAEVLKNGKIFSAGLDVWEDEPKIPAIFKGLKNIILTPHIGSATLEAREKMSEIVAKNIISVLKIDRALNQVN